MKQLSLLSLLLLTSTSCLAHGGVVSPMLLLNGVMHVICALLLYFLINALIFGTNLIIMALMSNFILKAPVDLKQKFREISFVDILLWASILLLGFILYVPIGMILFPLILAITCISPQLICFVIAHIIVNIPSYGWFFPALSKRYLIPLVFLAHLLNPLVWTLSWIIKACDTGIVYCLS